MGKFCQINYRVAALDLSSKLHFAQYLLNKWMYFDKNCVFWYILIRSGLG